MCKHHEVDHVAVRGDQLFLRVDGEEYVFRLSEISEKLANASDAERTKVEVSPSGYGLRWPLLDEDLSIDGLLGITHRPVRIRPTKEPAGV